MPLRAPRLLLLAAGLLATTFAVSALWIQKRGVVAVNALAPQRSRRNAKPAGAPSACLRPSGARGPRCLQGTTPAISPHCASVYWRRVAQRRGAPAELPQRPVWLFLDSGRGGARPRFPPWVHEWPGGPYDRTSNTLASRQMAAP